MGIWLRRSGASREQRRLPPRDSSPSRRRPKSPVPGACAALLTGRAPLWTRGPRPLLGCISLSLWGCAGACECWRGEAVRLVRGGASKGGRQPKTSQEVPGRIGCFWTRRTALWIRYSLVPRAPVYWLLLRGPSVLIYKQRISGD
jgi:hypothetical protein